MAQRFPATVRQERPAPAWPAVRAKEGRQRRAGIRYPSGTPARGRLHEVAAGGDAFAAEIGAAGLCPDLLRRVSGAAAASIAAQTREQLVELPAGDRKDLRP